MMNKIRYISVIVIVFLIFSGSGRADRGVPPSVIMGLDRVGEKAILSLDEPDVAQWLKEDQLNDGKGVPLRIGAVRGLPADLASRAEIVLDADYGLVWRLAIHSPGAFELKLHLSDVRLSGAGVLYIYSDGETESDMLTATDIYPDGTVWSWGSQGDTIVLEWNWEDTPGIDVTPPFQIMEISHIYKDMLELFAREGSCHNDATCDMDYRPERDATAQIEFNDDGTYVCSGTMLNSSPQNFVPFFLTANHCINTQSVASTLKAWFFFNSTDCDGPRPTRGYRTVAGSTLLATGAASGGNGSDYALLRLSDTDYTGVYLAGWDRNALTNGDAITGIHHPDGAYKRISYGTISSLTYNGQWGVTWNRTANPGVTEVGSSGSALFKDSNHAVVGQLWAGSSDCSFQNGKDYYGRFGNSFTHGNLGQWLGSSTSCSGVYWNGSAPTATPTQTATTPTPTRTPTSPMTQTPNPSWTPTPTTTPAVSVTIAMPSTMFHPGETFYCAVVIENSHTSSISNVALFVILDVYGQMLFLPEFDEFSYYPMNLSAGQTIVTAVPEFVWPAGTGSASGIHWYAGMTNGTFTQLIGNVDSFTFGWSDM